MDLTVASTPSDKEFESCGVQVASGHDLLFANVPRTFLTSDQEVRLTINIQNGCSHSQHELVRHNLRLVANVAKRYIDVGAHNGQELGDLIQEGCIGLIQAAKRFDPDCGNRFSTYAVYWIMKSITHSISKSGMIRTPAHVQDKIKTINKFIGICSQTLNSTPTLEEISSVTGLPIEKLRLYMNQARGVISLDNQLDSDSGMTFCDTVSDQYVNEQFLNVIYKNGREAMRQAINRLNDFEALVMVLRYGLESENPLSVKECARLLKISTSKVERAEFKAIKKLKCDSELSKEFI